VRGGDVVKNVLCYRMHMHTHTMVVLSSPVWRRCEFPEMYVGEDVQSRRRWLRVSEVGVS
jgi:hypothetical protein